MPLAFMLKILISLPKCPLAVVISNRFEKPGGKRFERADKTLVESSVAWTIEDSANPQAVACFTLSPFLLESS